MVPKTATNFHKMIKGLYNPLKGLDSKSDALAKSFNILYAYGELLPLTHSAKKALSVRKRPKSKKKVFEEDNKNAGRYMTVIRDSPNTVNKREQLEK
jgi:hypothetical protein